MFTMPPTARTFIQIIAFCSLTINHWDSKSFISIHIPSSTKALSDHVVSLQALPNAQTYSNIWTTKEFKTKVRGVFSQFTLVN